MASNNIDITQSGPVGYRDLQDMNSSDLERQKKAKADFIEKFGLSKYEPVSPHSAAYFADTDLASPFASQKTRTGGNDYWGNSFFDIKEANQEEFSNLVDSRAENQPWFSKILNGVSKAGVLAVTTAAELGGLIYGLGQGVYNMATDANGDSVGVGGEFLEGLWNNPITRALKTINDVSEELMPNYYTRDEMENPFGNIFTANFLGDKILKNLGFMVGAFYGGIPASKAIGTLGLKAAKRAQSAVAAEGAGMAKRVAELTAKYGDDVEGLNAALKAERLTDADRAARIREGLDKVRQVAQTTRATTMAIGSLGSAINEGAIEAINNSKDWADQKTMEAETEYQDLLNEIDAEYGNSEEGALLKAQATKDYQIKLAEIQEGRAKVGNADLLLNIPILTATNMFELGKLYSRGFDSTRRQMGSLWNGHRLPGEMKTSSLKSDRNWRKGVFSALMKSNAEGVEEYLQRAASDGAGEAVYDTINRFMMSGKSEDSKTAVDDYIAGFGKAIADNLNDPNAWEEYMIGAVSSLFGMPVFGSQTKNAYLGKGKAVGVAGGFVGNFQDYMKAKDNEEETAEYLNKRVQDPNFKALYSMLRKNYDLDNLLLEAIYDGDKQKFKDIEFEKLFEDIDAAASTGHLAEFKEIINYNGDYSDEDLIDVLKTTNSPVSAAELKQRDENKATVLQQKIEDEENAVEKKRLQKQLKALQDKISKNEYKDSEEGPFMTASGEITLTEEGRQQARDILDRNKKKLNTAIDNYLKVRNEIDVESDGNLKRKDIAALTMLKMKILDREIRSSEMAEELAENLKPLYDKYVKTLEEANNRLQKAEVQYDEALAMKPDEKHTQEDIEKARLARQKSIEGLKKTIDPLQRAVDLLNMFTGQMEMTDSEKKAMEKGLGRSVGSSQRNINSDEAQAALRSVVNVGSLLTLISKDEFDVDDSVKYTLFQDVMSLHALAQEKTEYNKTIREALGDPSLLNEIAKNNEEKLNKEEFDNKAEEMALAISEAKNMEDIDKLVRDGMDVNSDLVRTALQKAKEKMDDDGKKSLEDYERAFDFLNEVRTMLRNLSVEVGGEEIAGPISSMVAKAWLVALNQPNIYDKFVNELNSNAKFWKKSKNPDDKKLGEALEKILKDLDAARRSVETKKSDQVLSSPEEEKKGTESLAAVAAKRKENLLAELTAEMKKPGSPYVVFKISKLPDGDLKKKIVDFNKSQTKEEDKIHDSDLENIYQNIVDKVIETDKERARQDDSGDDINDDATYINEKSAEMQEEVRSHWISDYISQFFIGTAPKYFDYKVPYEDTSKKNWEQIAAIQELLQETLAYNFVDRNLLGYLYEATHHKIRIHFLKANDKAWDEENKVNPDGDHKNYLPITFLAIEWTDGVEEVIRTKVLGGNKKGSLDGLINLQTIKDSKGVERQYQIVGALSYRSEDADVKGSFEELQKRINTDTEEAREKADNSQKFVVWDKTTTISTMFTGRLEKRNDLEDVPSADKVSLHDFVATGQPDENVEGTEKRIGSLEWNNQNRRSGDGPFIFGVVTDSSGVNRTGINDASVQDPNSGFLEDRRNSGAVLLYIPKPDGKYYPIRCTRRTVKDWLNKKANATKTGEEVLEDVLNNSSESNGFIKKVVEYLKVLMDKDADFGSRMNAKTKLSKYFILGDKSPIHVDTINDKITIKFADAISEIDLDDGVNESIKDFFEILKENNVKFTIPLPDSEEGKNVSPRDIIESGIMEVGLRGFYNFNANFTLNMIDVEGNPIQVQAEGETRNVIRQNNNRLIFKKNGEDKVYLRSEENGNITITYEDGSEITDPDELNLITQIVKLQSNPESYPSASTTLLGEHFKKSTNLDSEVKDFYKEKLNKEGYGKVFIFNIDGTLWVYDRRQIDDLKIYKLGSETDKSLNNKVGLKESFGKVVEEIAKNNKADLTAIIKKLKDNKNKDAQNEPQDTSEEAEEEETAPKESPKEEDVVVSEPTNFFDEKFEDVSNDANTLAARFKKMGNKGKSLYNKFRDLEKAGIPMDTEAIKNALDDNPNYKDLKTRCEELVQEFKCNQGKL